MLNALWYIEHFLKIRTKDGQLVPFILNKPQRRLYDAIREQWSRGKPIRIIILKARQMGFSTLTEAILFFRTATAMYVNSFIVAHREDSTANLFRMSKRFSEELPPEVRPMQRSSNAQEIIFDRPARYRGEGRGLGSRIRCATAGGEGVGRSDTITCLHISEYAFWTGDKTETFTGLVQAVPYLPGTIIIVESTANGYDDFKKKWDAAVEAQRDGTEGFYPIFFPWSEMEEYRLPVPPGFERTPEEEQLAETFGLDDEQLAWRRWCISANCGGDVDKFHQEYPLTPDEAFISTGRCAFDKASLVLRREQVRSLSWERGMFAIEKDITGRIVKFEWRRDEAGPIRILRHPQQGRPYVLGGDTAGTGSDMFAGQMLDNVTGEQVAVIHHRFGERMFAEQAYCLGMYYNTALIGLETNYSTFPEMCLEELGYKKLYVRERFDTYTGKTVPAFGFETTSVTRPVIVDGLKDVARNNLETITDFDTLGEMLTFVYDERWKPQAEEGEHDDLVLALCIAHAIRGQQSTAVKTEKKKGQANWTRDMKEDYRRADPQTRRYLLEKWGDPQGGGKT